MVYVPTEKRYEKHIETELNNLIDDGLQFHSKIHKKGDGWYDKNLCVVGVQYPLALHLLPLVFAIASQVIFSFGKFSSPSSIPFHSLFIE